MNLGIESKRITRHERNVKTLMSYFFAVKIRAFRSKVCYGQLIGTVFQLCKKVRIICHVCGYGHSCEGIVYDWCQNALGDWGAEADRDSVKASVISANPMVPEASGQFARMAVEVWGIDPEGKTEKELAESFVMALSDFVKETELPTSFKEMGITDDTDYKAIADSTILTGGCVKRFTKEELLEVLLECR